MNRSLVVFGDSSCSSYRLEIKKNAFGYMLERRLQMECRMCFELGAVPATLLNGLMTNEEHIESVKNAELVVMSVGGNSLNVPILNAALRALNIGDFDIKVLYKIGKGLKKNPLGILKINKELHSKRTVKECEEGVESICREYARVIKRLYEINPNVKIAIISLYNPFSPVRGMAARIIGKDLAVYINKANDVLRSKQKDDNYMFIEFDDYLVKHRGKDKFTNIDIKKKDIDMHLTELGHETVCRLVYDRLIKDYPEFACADNPRVVLTPEIMTEKERLEQEKENRGSKGIFTPDGFNVGPNKKYNHLFGVRRGSDHFPLHVEKAVITDMAVASALKEEQDIVIKRSDRGVDLYNIDDVMFGYISGEDRLDDAPTLVEGFDRGLPRAAKVASISGDKIDIVYAVYPTREYYAEYMEKKKEREKDTQAAK